MSYRTFVFFIVVLYSACNNKPVIDNDQLTRELDSIFVEDQKYRAEMHDVMEKFGWSSAQMRELFEKQERIDSTNLVRIEEIIDLIGGYPGRSLVGTQASATTFYVLQHSPDSVQEKYYALIIGAAEDGELDRSLCAMYRDRRLMQRGEPQIFGTQIRFKQATDATGKVYDSVYVWPIKDTTSIDSIRKWNGLGPLEEYLNGFGTSRWKNDSVN